MPTLGPVAIIGAGISGLSCARSLQQAGVEVRIFERARRVGGRCATRLWQGHLVDEGVQYFTAETPEFKRELLTNLRQFRPLIPPILNAERKTVYSQEGPRFYVLQGNNYLAHVLARDLDVRLNTKIEGVTFREEGIEISGTIYRAVVSSLPAPQTNSIFGLSEAATEYVCCLSVILEYEGLNIGQSEHCYGLLTAPEAEPLEASYCENHKSGRILGEKTIFVLQTAPRFSEAHADRPVDDYVSELARLNEELWEIPAGKRTAACRHRWRLAHPREGGRRPFHLPPGAFVCGDSRSKSKVEEVWLDGRQAAKEVLTYLVAPSSRTF